MMKKIFTGELISYGEQLNVDEQIVEGIPGDPLALHRRGGDLDVLRDPLRLPLGDQSRRLARPLLTVGAVAGISIPVFLLAAVLLYFLTYKTRTVPRRGYVRPDRRPGAVGLPPDPPVVHPGAAHIGFYSRVLRSNMLDVMNEDYVRTARAKGLAERRVMIRHVLRNSLIPIVTLFGLDFGATDRRRRDHHRKASSTSTASGSTRRNRSPTSTCRR